MNRSASTVLGLLLWIGAAAVACAQTTAATWSTDWAAFAREVSKVISSDSPLAALPSFIGKEVEWSGTVRTIRRPGPWETNAHVNLAMPEASISMGAWGAGKLNQVGFNPKPDQWASWDGVPVGDRVVFRTTLAEGVGGGNPSMERAAKVGVIIAILNGNATALVSTAGGSFVRKATQ